MTNLIIYQNNIWVIDTRTYDFFFFFWKRLEKIIQKQKFYPNLWVFNFVKWFASKIVRTVFIFKIERLLLDCLHEPTCILTKWALNLGLRLPLHNLINSHKISKLAQTFLFYFSNSYFLFLNRKGTKKGTNINKNYEK